MLPRAQHRAASPRGRVVGPRRALAPGLTRDLLPLANALLEGLLGQLARIDAERLLQQIGVVLMVDLVGQLLESLLDVLVLTLLAEQVDYLLLVELHVSPPVWSRGGGCRLFRRRRLLAGEDGPCLRRHAARRQRADDTERRGQRAPPQLLPLPLLRVRRRGLQQALQVGGESAQILGHGVTSVGHIGSVPRPVARQTGVV